MEREIGKEKRGKRDVRMGEEEWKDEREKGREGGKLAESTLTTAGSVERRECC